MYTQNYVTLLVTWQPLILYRFSLTPIKLFEGRAFYFFKIVKKNRITFYQLDN